MSPSRAELYELCPYRYKLKYEDKVKQSSSSSDGGNLIHDALKFYYDPAARRSEDEAWNMATHARKCACPLEFKKAKELFYEYPRREPRDSIPQVMGVEVEMNFHLGSGALAKGFADRIDVMDRETIRINDYKTGNTVPTEEELRDAHQTWFYTFWSTIDKRCSRFKRVQFRYIYLRLCKSVVFNVDLGGIEWYSEYLDHLCNAILKDKRPARTLNRYCWNCPKRCDCPEYLYYIKTIGGLTDGRIPEMMLKGDVEGMAEAYASLGTIKKAAEQERDVVNGWLVAMLSEKGEPHRGERMRADLRCRSTEYFENKKGVVKIVEAYGGLEAIASLATPAMLRDAYRNNPAALHDIDYITARRPGNPYPAVSRAKGAIEACESQRFSL